MQLKGSKRVLYIGQYSEGTTSKQRADTLKRLLNSESFEIIDIHVPFYKTSRIWRSIGFRFKKGLVINRINNYIQSRLGDVYDLIWVDKGVYINETTTKILRRKTSKLVHFTPDPAFTFHKSALFNSSLTYYDYLITTKSYELENYKSFVEEKKVILTTQGFDKKLHTPGLLDFKSKAGLLFIGHHERNREEVLDKLLANNVELRLAGIKWDKFAKKHKSNKNLCFLGNGVYGKAYVEEIQKAKIAWGAISEWVPELHTTRTFEIPACGTALLTVRNPEIISFFNDNEAIFYSDIDELVERVVFYLNNPELLQSITENGYNKVVKSGFDYDSILERLIERIS